MTNNLAIVSPEKDESWQQIVDDIVINIDQEDIPESVVRAIELMLSGFPTAEVATQLGVKKETINRWLVKYPRISEILANHQSNLIKWRLAQIDKQFLQALQVSKNILELPLDADGVNAKLTGIVAAQARYIIGLRAGQKQDITVTHEIGDSVLQGREDALNYVAMQLNAQREGADIEPIETTFRIVDETKKDTGPFILDDGDSPFGEIGTLDKNEDGILCHACGQRYKSLKRHVLSKHNLGSTEYELLYGLDEGSLKKAEKKDD